MRRARLRGASVVGPLLGLVLAASGCIVAPPPVRIELLNTTALDVRPNFYSSSEAATSGELFLAENLRTDWTSRVFPELRAGETASLELTCADAAAVGVSGSIMFDALRVSAVTSPDVLFLLRDAEFGCGQTVRFTFVNDAGALRVQLSVE
ncbi:MAG: hypothetical protein HRF50_03580 [Phycisphaerae bacterium]|jgi:hypothetical protein